MQPRNWRNLASLELSLRLLAFLALALLAPTFPVQALAQSNDITFSLGGIPSQSRPFRGPGTGSSQISADVSLGTNYGHRFVDVEYLALYGQILFSDLTKPSV